MKKVIIFAVSLILVDLLLAQSGMIRFQGNMGGTSGTGIPVDGGISSVIIGSVIYGYKKIKEKVIK